MSWILQLWVLSWVTGGVGEGRFPGGGNSITRKGVLYGAHIMHPVLPGTWRALPHPVHITTQSWAQWVPLFFKEGN